MNPYMTIFNTELASPSFSTQSQLMKVDITVDS
jgi:hypothetical protein